VDKTAHNDRGNADSADNAERFIGVRETAKRLGVHENTVRNWSRNGALKPANVPGSRSLRFDAREVARLVAKRGQVVASVEEERRTVGPELVNASQLNVWAESRDAQDLFPELIRRLLASTPGVSAISVRAGDGVSAPGWDGQADSAGTSYLPAGRLLFEFGVGGRPREKAESDYKKRRTQPLGVDPESSIFIFATPRRWTTAEAWAAEKREEGAFADVRVIDADTLEGWLQRSPGVHVWISEKLGRRPEKTETIEHWWRRFRDRTEPPLPRGLFLAGREKQREQLAAYLGEGPRVITIKAEWRDDAVCFLVAVIEALEEEGVPIPKAILISSNEIWDRVAHERSPMTLVPLFDGADTAATIENGHHVVFPLGWDPPSITGEFIDIERPGRAEAVEAFEAAGISFELAYRLGAQARRSLPSLIRQLSRDPNFSRPPWSRPPASATLAPLVLLGSWKSTPDDLEIISRVAGKPWGEVERTLLQWRASEDPPFVRPSRQWHLASPQEAFSLLRDQLTGDDVDRWLAIVLDVLGEADPRLDLDPEERPMAAIQGAVRQHSSVLRKGIAQGVALISLAESEIVGGTERGADLAKRATRTLLSRANADPSGRAWASLADELQLLAEASPEEFLDAVHSDLDRNEPVLAKIFTDQHQESAFLGSSSHPSLLWALELLCWSAEHFPSAARALARLDDIDPGGKLSNRPIRSLASVMVGWIRQTSAPLEVKLEVLGQICSQLPDTGWELVLNLWPSSHAVVMPPAAPAFHDWRPDSREVKMGEWIEFVDALVGRAIELADRDPERWATLVERLGPLPPGDREAILVSLREFVSGAELGRKGRLDLWERLDREVARHRSFPDAHWSITGEGLERMVELAEELRPIDDVARHAYLFEWNPDLPGLELGDPGYEERVAELRDEAISEALSEGQVGELSVLAERSRAAMALGVTLGRVASEEYTPALLEWLDADQDSLRAVAAAWGGYRLHGGGMSWLKQTLARPEMRSAERRLAIALAAPPSARTWDALSEMDPALAEAYWKRANAWGVSAADSERAVFELLRHDRPWTALQVLAMLSHQDEEAEQLRAETIVAVLDALLQASSTEESIQSAGYEVGGLIDALGKLGVPDEKLASYEFGFFRILEDFRRPEALYKILLAEPKVFIDLVTRVYRGRNEPRRQLSEAEQALAEHAWWVLEHLDQLPGLREDGTVDGAHLTAWVRGARLAFADSEREDIGDEQIGRVLSTSPDGNDGIWPAEPVRDLLESIGSTHMETGVHSGVINARGFTSRGIYDGGEQERVLAERYRRWAKDAAVKWPRTSRVLRGLAETYERDASDHDAEAEVTADTE
jgi:hypothetical protein